MSQGYLLPSGEYALSHSAAHWEWEKYAKQLESINADLLEALKCAMNQLNRRGRAWHQANEAIRKATE